MKKSTSKISAIILAAILTAPILKPSAALHPVTAIAAENTPAKRQAKQYYVTADILNVRSGPGTDYSSIGSLSQGMRVKVISIKGEKGNRWAKIKFQGVTAYVSAKHLAKSK